MKPRTRTVKQTEMVPVTRDGKTHMTRQISTVEQLLPPRDWDQIVLTAVTGVAITVGIGCVAWSTSAIGHLLSTAAHPAIAYGGAGTFDLLWMTCIALGWLARYEPGKAKGPLIAGYVGLAVAVGALVTEGALGGHLAAGIVGAGISIGAKALWELVLRHHAKALDPDTQQWVDLEMAEVGGELALAAVRRRLARSRQQLAAHTAAYRNVDDDAGPTDAERAAEYARALSPGASDDDIEAQLIALGLVTSPVMSPVTSPPWDDHPDDQQHDHRHDRIPAACSTTASSSAWPAPAGAGRHGAPSPPRRPKRSPPRRKSATSSRPSGRPSPTSCSSGSETAPACTSPRCTSATANCPATSTSPTPRSAPPSTTTASPSGGPSETPTTPSSRCAQASTATTSSPSPSPRRLSLLQNLLQRL